LGQQLTDYQFTFLNYKNPDIAQDISAVNSSTDHWESLPAGITKIITSQDPLAEHLAQSIQPQTQAEILISDLWQPNSQQTQKPSSQNGNFSSLHLQAGKALQSLFKHPPGKYLIILQEDIFTNIIASIFGGIPHGKAPHPLVHTAATTQVSIRYELRSHKWNILQVNQPKKPANISTSQVHNITLIRHGESLGNVQRVFQGQKDFPLSDEGKNQARQLAKHLKTEKTNYKEIISSPLTRTMQTAEIIADELGLSIQTDALWIEIDNGNLAGVPGKKLGKKQRKREDRFNPFKPVGEIGESWWELYLRGSEALLNLLERPPGSYLVVSHGGILNAALWNVFGTPPQPGALTPTFYFRNTATANLIFDHQHWELVSFAERVKI
jgi:broad specificity phosphatase PhoE